MLLILRFDPLRQSIKTVDIVLEDLVTVEIDPVPGDFSHSLDHETSVKTSIALSLYYQGNQPPIAWPLLSGRLGLALQNLNWRVNGDSNSIATMNA